jgi:ubiquinone/menaquinone biosynthesis C-methylase UbiE
MSSAIVAVHHAGEAFDRIADDYDSLFTHTVVGRLQRQAVWRKARQIFGRGDRVLELNCGTGEDALFLARNGISVCACDASAGMIERSRARMSAESSSAQVEFRVLATEDLHALPAAPSFDGAFSNFAGLNCIQDLSQTASELARLLRPGAQLLLCFATRFCAWEMAYYSLHGEFKNALRRISGSAEARVGGCRIRVYYPRVRQVLRAFRPTFTLRSMTGIGVTVPPSYLEHWAERHTSLMYAFDAMDRVLCRWPGIRVVGDHILIHLERAQ